MKVKKIKLTVKKNKAEKEEKPKQKKVEYGKN